MNPQVTDKSARYRSTAFGRSWFNAELPAFVHADPYTILGSLTANSDFPVDLAQRDAWLQEVRLLRKGLQGLDGFLHLEFNIPRMGKRIDAVVLFRTRVLVIEFKIGEARFLRNDINQVWDYALDLKNFHEASHKLEIVPILVATGASAPVQNTLSVDGDGLYRPYLCRPQELPELLKGFSLNKPGENVDAAEWERSHYRPTPTIIEAARSLYANHSVEAIARSDAGAKNLAETSHRLETLIASAITNRKKLICFVTGVPGAGKTLVGLNVATTHRPDTDKSTHATFLSGNGPLVQVLREALSRDKFERHLIAGERLYKGRIRTEVSAVIQNVHHFRDEALIDDAPPSDHVVIFDEAQRAWNLEQTAKFMRNKRGQPGFSQSEPEFLISYLDRHEDWAVIVCLVGGGQEINTGEAGIQAWLHAVSHSFPHWQVHISSNITSSEYPVADVLKECRDRPGFHMDDKLHLAVSMRCFRAGNVSAFVRAVLDCDEDAARASLQQMVDRYPIVISRNIEKAKNWIRSQARGSERYGLVASSKAQRLKPHAIDIRYNVDPVQWFLNDAHDTRSSFYLEDAATEFQVQGLELDWACVSWDGDLRYSDNSWSYHSFVGDRWNRVLKADRQRYLLNAYRVLLTRARQGMVIFVPEGTIHDLTRAAQIYDGTFEYLSGLGIACIDG